MEWSESQLNGFHSAAQSLKLYRRADLQDEEGENLVADLYVDPLPRSHVLQTMVGPNTTFLIGRKGTGKSTIFQRAQHELRQYHAVVSAYVDIKTVFESAQVDQTLLTRLETSNSALSRAALEKLLLYESFLREAIREIQKELKERVSRTFWERFRHKFNGMTLDECFSQLDELISNSGTESFRNVTGVVTESITERRSSSDVTESSARAGANLSASPALSASLGAGQSISTSDGTSIEYSQVLMRELHITDYLVRLQDILNGIGISHLYVFIDDFSELPEPAMRLVVDTLLAPLNNWSNELVKFKIAAYPGRIYLGDIDRKKVDEISLDTYDLYGRAGVAEMEKKAVEFTARLLERRIAHYCNCSIDQFFDRESSEVVRHLFYATMGNPRNLGYLMVYLYELSLIYGKPITTSAVGDAARRYYEEKIESYFNVSKFAQETFAERSSIFSLKELLESIVSRARALKFYRESQALSKLRGQPPTSHFHVISEYEPILATLELNFFITKYFQQKDRDGRPVTVYALNYGLCQIHAIVFGRPRGERLFRLYFVERIFDYTPILKEYVASNQEIKCDNCGAEFDHDKLAGLVMYDMLCPSCRRGRCEVINLSKRYESLLKQVNEELLLPRTELNILHALETEGRPMFAKEIAQELDSSHQLVGKRGKILSERGLVSRTSNQRGRRTFAITKRAEAAYFSELEPEMKVRASSADTDPVMS